MYRLRTVEGLSLREIAERFGITGERVRQVLDNRFSLRGEPPAVLARRSEQRKARGVKKHA